MEEKNRCLIENKKVHVSFSTKVDQRATATPDSIFVSGNQISNYQGFKWVLESASSLILQNPHPIFPPSQTFYSWSPSNFALISDPCVDSSTTEALTQFTLKDMTVYLDAPPLYSKVT